MILRISSSYPIPATAAGTTRGPNVPNLHGLAMQEQAGRGSKCGRGQVGLFSIRDGAGSFQSDELAARRKTGPRTGRVIVVEIKARRARRIGGYGEFCATRRSAARDGPGAAPFFDGLLAQKNYKKNSNW